RPRPGPCRAPPGPRGETGRTRASCGPPAPAPAAPPPAAAGPPSSAGPPRPPRPIHGPASPFPRPPPSGVPPSAAALASAARPPARPLAQGRRPGGVALAGASPVEQGQGVVELAVGEGHLAVDEELPHLGRLALPVPRLLQRRLLEL